jgi:ankyrin repeat protein
MKLLGKGVIVVILCVCGFYRSTAGPTPKANEDPFGNRDLTQGSTDEVKRYRMSFRDAVIDDELELVEAFLRHGITIELPAIGTGIGDILDDAAYFTRDPRMVRLLLDHGAKPGGAIHERNATMNSALRLGNKEIVDQLIAAGAGCDPLWYDAALGFIDDLKKRDAQQPMDAKVSADALEYAASAGQVETFDWLWAKARGEDAAAQAKKLEDFYNRAAGNGHLALLQHLEQMGVKPADGGVKALTLAAGRNHVAEAKHLLEMGVAPPKDPYFLRNAAGEGYLEIVKLLLDHGVDPNATDGQGFTPLAWAAYEGREDVCQLLVERGVNLEVAADNGRTALWQVVGSTHCPETLALMLKKGVHINWVDTQGRSLLEVAFNFMPHRAGQTGFPGRVLTLSQLREYEQREERIIDLLISAGLDPSGKEGTSTPLMAALRSNHYPAARALLRHHPDLNVKDESGNPAITTLFNRCYGPFPLDVLESFLEQGCDPNANHPIPGWNPRRDLTVLEMALGSFRPRGVEEVEDHRAAIRKLLAHGGTFSGTKSDADQALLVAAASGDLQKMTEAVAKGASLDAKESAGYTPLLISASLRYFDHVFWLLGQGADPKESSLVWGESLLPAAVTANRPDVVNLLISKGVDASQGSGLNIAVQLGNQQIFDALIGAGANPKDGNLFTCIQNGRVEMARVLLQFGADPQPPPMMENRGNVYWAVYYEQPEILKMLLDRGANPNLVDAYGETPLSMAKEFHKDLARILEEAIARRKSEAKGDEAK